MVGVGDSNSPGPTKFHNKTRYLAGFIVSSIKLTTHYSTYLLFTSLLHNYALVKLVSIVTHIIFYQLVTKWCPYKVMTSVFSFEFTG